MERIENNISHLERIQVKDLVASRNFHKRVITAVVLVTVVVASVLHSLYNFMLLVLLVNMLGVNEFYTITKISPARKKMGLFASLLLFVTTTLVIAGSATMPLMALNIPMAFIILLAALYDRSPDPFAELAMTFFGIIYVTVPCILLVLLTCMGLPEGAYQSHLALGLFFIVWANDTGAYFAGKFFGRHRLFARVSPAKSWEGSIGGTICVVIVALLCDHYFHQLHTADWLAIACIVITAGTLSDLIKSRLKRSHHIKDSGNLLPGHGGVLDRFDSLLGSSVFVLCYFLIVRYV